MITVVYNPLKNSTTERDACYEAVKKLSAVHLQTVKTFDVANVVQELTEEISSKDWRNSRFLKELNQSAKGDVFVFYKPNHVTFTTAAFLQILTIAHNRGAYLFCAKDSKYLPCKPVDDQDEIDSFALLKTVKAYIQSCEEYRLERFMESAHIGRPKGKKNKKRKLDKYYKEIRNWLELGIPNATIAKLTGCHTKTVSNYINDKGLA